MENIEALAAQIIEIIPELVKKKPELAFKIY